VYVATADGEPQARDDARNLVCVMPSESPPLAFDHATIIEDYLRYLATGMPAPLR
jgi:8-oxo-dGTP diphosphatase